jgi:hypothetical protein
MHHTGQQFKGGGNMSENPTVPSPELINLIAQAEEGGRQIHDIKQRAEDEATYATNARRSAEEHSSAIAALKGQAEADGSWFQAMRNRVDQSQATISQIRAEAESAKQAVAEALATIEQARAAAKSGSEQAKNFRTQAEKAASDAAAHHKSTIGSSSAAGTARESALADSGRVAEVLEGVTELAAKVEAHATTAGELDAAMGDANEQAQKLVTSMADADSKAKNTVSVLATREKEFVELQLEFKALHARIESLLPNATSAGLATAFREQKARFERPQKMWLATFVATILALLASSLWGLPGSDSWDAMGRHLVHRLPIIAPLIWLAIYAGRHYGLALRLQEEYAYKEAVSAAFEGYKREMNTVGAATDGRSPLVTLCENVLNTLGQRPGRIYEGKHDDITPMNTAASAVKDAAMAAKEAVQMAKTAPKA